MARNPKFHELIDQIRDLHDRKNNDYATTEDPLSNFRECEGFGIPALDGLITRMSDKWSRMQQLYKGKEQQVKDESIEDTMMDLAVYSLIGILLLRERSEQSLSEQPLRQSGVAPRLQGRIESAPDRSYC